MLAKKKVNRKNIYQMMELCETPVPNPKEADMTIIAFLLVGF